MNRRKKLMLAGVFATLLLGAALAIRLGPGLSPGALLHVGFGWGVKAPSQDVVASRLQVPQGFTVSRFAEGLGNVRFLRFTQAGELLVSVPRAGNVLLLGLGRPGETRPAPRTLLHGLKKPHVLDFHDGWLYIAETDAVGRVRFDHSTGQVSGPIERVVTGLPEGGNHWTRTVRFGPDGLMYVSVGSSCNVCIEEDRRRAAILRYHPDGSGEELFATGLRNSVGLDFHPKTGELYATDNGRDLLGDDFPPCELNRVVQGGFYGWPFASGDRVSDPDFGKGHEAEVAATIPPEFKFRAHNAPLGMTFLRGERLPTEYRGSILVALHGSWNRKSKDGYKVVLLKKNAAGQLEQSDFLTGFLRDQDQDVIGRPVDVAEGPDGAIYVSDDYTGSIFRVTYGETASAIGVAAAPRPAQPTLQGPSAAANVRELPDRDRVAAHARGAQLFAKWGCAGCHIPGQSEKGVVPHLLTGAGGRYSLSGLTEYFLAPRPPMPAFPLSTEDRRDLAVYLGITYP